MRQRLTSLRVGGDPILRVARPMTLVTASTGLGRPLTHVEGGLGRGAPTHGSGHPAVPTVDHWRYSPSICLGLSIEIVERHEDVTLVEFSRSSLLVRDWARFGVVMHTALAPTRRSKRGCRAAIGSTARFQSLGRLS